MERNDILRAEEAVHLCGSLRDSSDLHHKNEETEAVRGGAVLSRDDVEKYGLVLTENGLNDIAKHVRDSGIIIPDNPNLGVVLSFCDADNPSSYLPYNQDLGRRESVMVENASIHGTDLHLSLSNKDIQNMKAYRGRPDDFDNKNPCLIIHGIIKNSESEGIVPTPKFYIEMKTAAFSHDNSVSYRIEDYDRKNEVSERKVEKEENPVPDFDLERYRPSNGSIHVIETIRENGGEAFLVGGCIRDAMLGLPNHDEDVTTNLTPDQVTKLFNGTDDAFVVPTGIDHGTVTIFLRTDEGNIGYEVTTYRIDGASSDQRHPDSVTFSTDVKEDLMRRDFTINAIAYDPVSHEIVDPFGGRQDMENEIVRSVGNPNDRIEEDALRMMRGIRFSVQKDMALDDELKTAISDHAEDIGKISKERIGSELTGILMSGHPGNGMHELHETGLLKEIAPALDREYDTPQHNPWHIYDVGGHTEKVLDNTPKDVTVRLAAMCHDIGKPETKTTDAKGIDHFYGHDSIGAEITGQLLRELRFPADEIKTVQALVSAHESRIEPDNDSIRTFIEKHPGFDNETLHKLIDLQTADKLGQNPAKNPDAKEKAVEIHDMTDKFTEGPYRIKDLAIDGKEIAGIQETKRGDTVILSGHDIQIAKEKLLGYVLKNQEMNNPTDLCMYVRDHLKEIKNESIDKTYGAFKEAEKERYEERKELNEAKQELIRLDPHELEKEKKEFAETGKCGSDLEQAMDLKKEYDEKIGELKEASTTAKPLISDEEKRIEAKENDFKDDLERKEEDEDDFDAWTDPID